MDDFPDIDEISETARSLQGRVSYSSTEWRVYPQLRFPCGGDINSITVMSFTPRVTVDIILCLWEPVPPPMPSGGTGDRFTDADTHLSQTLGPCNSVGYRPIPNTLREGVSSTSGGVSGFHTVELSFDEDLIALPGAVLAIRQREGILLYERGNSSLPVPSRNRTVCTQDDVDYVDFPFISVDIGKLFMITLCVHTYAVIFQMIVSVGSAPVMDFAPKSSWKI